MKSKWIAAPTLPPLTLPLPEGIIAFAWPSQSFILRSQSGRPALPHRPPLLLSFVKNCPALRETLRLEVESEMGGKKRFLSHDLLAQRNLELAFVVVVV